MRKYTQSGGAISRTARLGYCPPPGLRPHAEMSRGEAGPGHHDERVTQPAAARALGGARWHVPRSAGKVFRAQAEMHLFANCGSHGTQRQVERVRMVQGRAHEEVVDPTALEDGLHDPDELAQVGVVPGIDVVRIDGGAGLDAGGIKCHTSSIVHQGTAPSGARPAGAPGGAAPEPRV